MELDKLRQKISMFSVPSHNYLLSNYEKHQDQKSYCWQTWCEYCYFGGATCSKEVLIRSGESHGRHLHCHTLQHEPQNQINIGDASGLPDYQLRQIDRFHQHHYQTQERYSYNHHKNGTTTLLMWCGASNAPRMDYVLVRDYGSCSCAEHYKSKVLHNANLTDASSLLRSW